jgi:hypothetical protein
MTMNSGAGTLCGPGLHGRKLTQPSQAGRLGSAAATRATASLAGRGVSAIALGLPSQLPIIRGPAPVTEDPVAGQQRDEGRGRTPGFEVEGLRRSHYRRRDGSLRSALVMARLLDGRVS